MLWIFKMFYKRRPRQASASRSSIFTPGIMRFSGWLQRMEARLSQRQKKWVLALFVLLFAGSSIGILSATLLGQGSMNRLLRPGKVVQPFIQPKFNTEFPLLIDTLAFRRFCHALDSLKRTPGGRRQVDSLFSHRPGLADSIRQMKQALFHFKKAQNGNRTGNEK